MARTFLGQIYALVPIGIVGARLGFGAPRSRSRRDLGAISARSLARSRLISAVFCRAEFVTVWAAMEKLETQRKRFANEGGKAEMYDEIDVY